MNTRWHTFKPLNPYNPNDLTAASVARQVNILMGPNVNVVDRIRVRVAAQANITNFKTPRDVTVYVNAIK